MKYDSIDKLERMVRGIRIFRKSAKGARSWAAGQFGESFPELKRKWLRQAARRDRAVKRLAIMAARQCDKIREEVLNDAGCAQLV